MLTRSESGLSDFNLLLKAADALIKIDACISIIESSNIEKKKKEVLKTFWGKIKKGLLDELFQVGLNGLKPTVN